MFPMSRMHSALSSVMFSGSEPTISPPRSHMTSAECSKYSLNVQAQKTAVTGALSEHAMSLCSVGFVPPRIGSPEHAIVDEEVRQGTAVPGQDKEVVRAEFLLMHTHGRRTSLNQLAALPDPVLCIERVSLRDFLAAQAKRIRLQGPGHSQQTNRHAAHSRLFTELGIPVYKANKNQTL